jgi:hypothetical protein
MGETVITMSKRILIFNVIYYAVTLFFIILGRDDPSSSLGYGFFIIGFWIIAAIALAFFLIKKTIWPKSFLDKIGIFTATPILSIVAVSLILTLSESESSEWYFNKGNNRYKVKTIYYKPGSKVKRIEYYRNANEEWLRDSTWIYFSEAGDTIRKVKYRNNTEISKVIENK